MSGSMNYIGSISILDRGDAPAQAIMDRNARSLAQRVADETRDELNKVMSRVHTIYGAMDTVEEVYPTSGNMEYLNDLAELEAILKDEIKKRQYQQQVTVFVVGYQDVCHQKLRLLQQVNEFFMEHSKNIDEEDWFPTTPDIDLDEVTDTVEESLNHAHDLTVRLSELNREMVDYMASLAEKKASNKGRKKIEKALQQAKDEVAALSEKLMTLQSEVDQREEKVQNVQKMMDMKNLELQKYRTAAELGKQKLVKLQKDLDDQKASYDELKNDMTKLLDNQIHAMHESHQQELDELKKEHLTTNGDLKREPDVDTPSEVARIFDLVDSEPSHQASRQSSKQSSIKRATAIRVGRKKAAVPPTFVIRTKSTLARKEETVTTTSRLLRESRPSTKDTRTSGKSQAGKAGGKGSKSPTRQSKTGSRASGGKSDAKEYAEAAVQDEGGDPNAATVDDKVRTPGTRHSKRARSTLDPVLESDYDNAFDLFDEDSWSAVAGDQMSGKFAQYRRLSKHRLLELEEQLQLTQAKTKRKVLTLKAQFQEHKGKWEAERKILIEQVDQSLRLQTDAEKEADAAMTQLEDFITEQERLEQEEEVKRGEILQTSVSLTSQDGLTPPQGSLGASPEVTGVTPGQVMLTPESEQELQRLMQQTDDAKVQELNARLGTCVSAPPSVDASSTAKVKDADDDVTEVAEVAEVTEVTEVEQEVDAEDNNAPSQLHKQEAEVDLSQLKELPLLDIVDTKPPPSSKPQSAYILPSEATFGSSFQDPLETPLAELLNQSDDPMKLLQESEQEVARGGKGGELMDDGSYLEKARSNVTTEREATNATIGGGGEGGSEVEGVEGLGSGVYTQQNSTLGGAAGGGSSISKQGTEVSMVNNTQGSFFGKSLSSVEGTKMEGMTEEEIRATSAQSRASLRSVYKVKLEETRSSAGERRSKSPAIRLPTQLTIDAELILDDDDDGDDEEEVDEEAYEEMLKDPSMYEIGTSPPPMMSRDNTLASQLDRKLSGGVSRDPTDDFDKHPVRPVQKILKKGQAVLSHPLLQEYLKTYHSVVQFRDSMGKMFLDKDMMSAHQMTNDLETLSFDKGQKAMPQVEQLTKNAYYVLDEISSLITNILVYDREPPVSSLMHFSREATQKSFSAAQSMPPSQLQSQSQTFLAAPSMLGIKPESVPVPAAPPATVATTTPLGSRSSSSSKDKVRSSSASSDKMHIRELQDQYNLIKNQMDENKKQHHDQLQHNTVVMMGMQDTINDLQRELSALGKAATAAHVTSNKKGGQLSKPQSSSSNRGAGDKPMSPETTIMFTRLDSERNAKIMKKAVHEEKMNTGKYKEAVSRMDQYVSLPAQRLTHLVKKYVHHSHMREIEENVKNSSSIDQDVFDVLDKMETLQNQRARQWAERMDEMGIERLRLANLLMTSLEEIEQESGIFLIKPMYSYRGRDTTKAAPQGKLSRPIKSQSTQHRRVITPSNDAASSFIPAPTPASNYRLVKHERHFLQQQQQQAAMMGEMKPMELPRSGSEDGKEVKVMGSGLTFSASSPRLTWNMQASHPWTGKEDPNSFNTPRILELDINRMMIGQNNISSRVPFPPTDDRLINASQNSLRSYVTVNRPTAKFGAEKGEGGRPGSAGQDSQRPASTPRTKRVRVSDTDKDIPASLETAPPLPPITPTQVEVEEKDEGHNEGEEEVRPPSVAFSNDEEEEEEEEEDEGVREPPQSPPGSSLYQSVTHRNEDGEPGGAKNTTRTPSGFSLSEDD